MGKVIVTSPLNKGKGSERIRGICVCRHHSCQEAKSKLQRNYTPTRIAKIKRTGSTKCWREAEVLTPSGPAGVAHREGGGCPRPSPHATNDRASQCVHPQADTNACMKNGPTVACSPNAQNQVHGFHLSDRTPSEPKTPKNGQTV